jgi:hypothetical protein
MDTNIVRELYNKAQVWEVIVGSLREDWLDLQQMITNFELVEQPNQLVWKLSSSRISLVKSFYSECKNSIKTKPSFG